MFEYKNVLPLHLPRIIWIFTKGEGDRIESRIPFRNLLYFTYLNTYSLQTSIFVFHHQMVSHLECLYEITPRKLSTRNIWTQIMKINVMNRILNVFDPFLVRAFSCKVWCSIGNKWTLFKLTLFSMRGDTFISLFFLDQILSASFPKY